MERARTRGLAAHLDRARLSHASIASGIEVPTLARAARFITNPTAEIERAPGILQQVLARARRRATAGP